jgi:predicted aspartyl protease
MPRLLQLLGAVLLSVFLTQCAGGPAGQRGGSPRAGRLAGLGYESMPLQRSSGDARYSGRFKVNGQEVRFLIDSGANSTDLDHELAARYGIKPEKSIKVVSRGALGRPVTSMVGLGALAAGSVTAAPCPFMLAPPADRHTATSRYDGQMGLDALSGLGALVDLQTGHLWLPGPRARNARRGQISPLGRHEGLGFEALPLERAGHLPHLLVECSYEGRRLTWVVDTGAEVTVMASESVDALGIPTTASRSKIIDASGDRAAVRTAILRNVVFGRLLVSEFQVAATPLAPIRRTFRDRYGRPVDGIIGMDFLEESAALLDTGSRFLYVGVPERTRLN